MFSAPQADKISQLPRSFKKPMGIAKHPDGNRIAIACKDEVITFSQSEQLAAHYPNKPQTYDKLFTPRLTYHTGPLDIHDLSYGKGDNLFGVNTLFSCIVTLDDEFNFTPFWKPSFVHQISGTDMCHLNGMAMENELPRYVTAFGKGNTKQSWRDTLPHSGILIDVKSNDILCEGLSMPHSPRIYNGKLYCLMSATGEFIEIDRTSGKHTVITQISGFVRGLDFYEDFAFIGVSALRKKSKTFEKLDDSALTSKPGIQVIQLSTGKQVGKIEYISSVEEIYDVHVLPGMKRPNILNTIKPDYKLGVMIPHETFWARTSE